MANYDVLVETINPCGGTKHSQKDFIEVTAESPEAYVKENGRWPILEVSETSDGDTVITTGDGEGYMIRYVFSE